MLPDIVLIIHIPSENPTREQPNTLQVTPSGVIYFVDRDGKILNFGTGGGGGGGGAQCLKLVVGESPGLEASGSTYTNPVLIGKSIDFIALGSLFLFDFGAAPGFVFDPGTGLIDISAGPGVWGADGDPVYIQYRNA
jgi:hypothetical protein